MAQTAAQRDVTRAAPQRGREKERRPRVDEVLAGYHGPVLAAVDLGSSSCRLLIAIIDGDGSLKVIDAFSRPVRLGEGINGSGRLELDARHRTISALRVVASKVRRASVTHFRAVATEACRRASNACDFISGVERETGLSLEVISCEEEARLALMGVAPLLEDAPEDVVVFDIGGASTEVIMARREPGNPVPRLLEHVSLPFGVVTLAADLPDCRKRVPAYRSLVDRLTHEFASAAYDLPHGLFNRPAGSLQVVGASGTVTTLAGMIKGLPKYSRDQVDGCWLDTGKAHDVICRLTGECYEERAKNGCIGHQRADLVLPGCAIYEAILNVWPAHRVRVADRGVREGILYDLSQAADARSQHEASIT